MIKHIVFDMEQVLVSYAGDLVCQRCTENEQGKEGVSTSVFVSPEWILLDMSVMSEEEALKKMQDHLDAEHKRDMAVWYFRYWHEYSMRPKEGMEQVVRWLKSMGYGIYLYSNASVRLLTCYKEVIPAIDCFDGVLFSADVRCLKPQKEMYQHLFDRFRLKSEEYFFINNLSLNIEGTYRYGMDGYCFEDKDVGKLKEVLGFLNRQQLHFNEKWWEVWQSMISDGCLW